MKILIEGIDGTGKSTLAKSLGEYYDIPCIKHLGKPKSIKRYNGCKRKYQLEVFRRFNKLLQSNISVVYDRAHLGEFVYGPLYRDKPCTSLINIEKKIKADDILLILLVTTDFSILRDDGENFNTENQDLEQEMFKNAFEKSRIKNKIMIEINDEEGFRCHDDILKEVKLRNRTKTNGDTRYIQRYALNYADTDEMVKNLSAEERDWYLDWQAGHYNCDFTNEVSSKFSEEYKQECREAGQARRRCVLSAGKANFYEEREEYENIEAEVHDYDDELTELAKFKGTQGAIDHLRIIAEDSIVSLGISRDEAEFQLHKDVSIILADEKKTKSKKYAKLTKAELRAKERDEQNN